MPIERRQRKKSSPKPERLPESPNGYNRDPPAKKQAEQTELITEPPEKSSVELPDAFCKYVMLKHSDTWQKFTEFAKTKKTFSMGLARLLDILKTGDEQDKKIFGLFPLDVLAEFELEVELEGCKDEYAKSGSITLGSPKWPWRKVISECLWIDSSSSAPNLITEDTIKLIADEQLRSEALSNLEYSKKHPIVRKALEIFGGTIRGYSKSGENGDECLEE